MKDISEFEKKCQMTIEEFKSAVETCCILNSDGFGYFGTENKISNKEVICIPSFFNIIPKWATHVYWFNK